METALISLVSVALVIIGTVTMTLNAFQAVTKVADSVKDMEQQTAQIRRTEIVSVPPADYTGGPIDMSVRNDGQTDLASFASWDVIALYQSGASQYVAYSASYPPGSNQWALEGIYLTDNTSRAEVFNPNILNPGETMKLRITLSPEIGAGETSRITVSTPNGVTSQCLVTRR